MPAEAKVPRTFRIEPSTDARITQLAEFRGMDRSALVRDVLAKGLASKEDHQTIYLPGWIADRTGLDRRAVRAKIRRGDVWIAGQAWKKLEVNRKTLERGGPVVMDGQALE